MNNKERERIRRLGFNMLNSPRTDIQKYGCSDIPPKRWVEASADKRVVVFGTYLHEWKVRTGI